LSIDIIPEHSLDIEPQSPCLQSRFSEGGETFCASRLLEQDPQEEKDEDPGFTKTEAVIMEEVADWLETRHCDEFWALRRTPRQVSSKDVVLQSFDR
jgi:hypothetical protein